MNELVGRTIERSELDALLAAIRIGESRALVLRGETGAGKTTLLDYLAGRASGCRVVRTAAASPERGLPFAALHQLCAPLLGGLDGLPAPQRDALRVAFGFRAGPQPELFLVGLGVLGLLAEHARERPVVCLVDDAQWLDPASAQVLGLAARRVRAEAVAVVFAGCSAPAALDGVPALAVAGLSDPDARLLLGADGCRGPVDGRLLDRLIAECHGNPLALLELPRDGALASLGLLAESVAVPARVEELARRGSAGLGVAERLVLLVAAIEPFGDPVLVWRAAARLGVSAGTDAEVAGALEAAGLVDFDSGPRFRHPLLRTAVYRAADPVLRHRAHAALAEVIDPAADPEGHAWQRAQAATGPEEDLAGELEERAVLGPVGGGLAAAFWERAADLSADAGRRGERLLAAAELRHLAGTPSVARRLLAMAEAGPLGELAQARADVLRAGGDPSLLLKAAARMRGLDAARARVAYLDALRAAWPAGGPILREVVEAGEDDPLLDAIAVRCTAGLAAAAPLLRAALSRLGEGPGRAVEDVPGLWLAGLAALELGDDAVAGELTARCVRLATETGAVAMLPDVLAQRVVSRVRAGAPVDARAPAEWLARIGERARHADPAGSGGWGYAGRLLSAWAGHEVDGFPAVPAGGPGRDGRWTVPGAGLGDRSAALVSGHGPGGPAAERNGPAAGLVEGRSDPWAGRDEAAAVLLNGLGRYAEAYAAAVRHDGWACLVERVVAAAHLGRADRAGLGQLSGIAREAGTDGLLGLAALGRGMLGGREDGYREAVERLERAGMRGYLGRAQLYYGEWLWRVDRRSDARVRLRGAYEMMRETGLLAFAERAGERLGVAGRKRPGDVPGGLTGQETRIVRLAREGMSNVEIASRLFLSPRTVEWHLSKVFTKLGIRSRRQLLRGAGPWRSGEWGAPRSASA